MLEAICPFENQVEAAVVSGTWNPELQSHVESCSICQDLVRVSEYLQTAATASTVKAVLPGPTYIWYRAQWLHRQEAERRFARLLAMIRMVGYLVFLCGMGGWLLVHWPDIQREVGQASPWLVTRVQSGLALVSQPLGYLTITLFGINLGLTFWSLWRERQTHTA
ncbi:MAG TPA: hypothetical protein PLB18_13050 [Acidobacteriota bacterium]|nr:hypothetical protein [Acidobacteriota bacterium]HNB73693.1 hypothetical protein [Acidobacteriota bacterium]HND20297.1 hypothetical protein [Acidobacteriota bacterium]HNG93182.1 hypothetical protein [Acidobacteriota bacterium]HNH82747.1 hypothetical protein [Acidobacteriota bacterium]